MAQEQVDRNQVETTLRDVVDPELSDNIVDLGMLRGIAIDSGVVTVSVALTIASCPLRPQLTEDITRRVGALAGVTSVEVETGAMSQDERSALMARARWKAREKAPETRVPSQTKVLAIASGKGGVGKSSVTVNLATAMAAAGARVGVLDADIAGFTIPRMLGVEQQLTAKEGRIEPFVRPIGQGTLEIVSMGLIEGSGEDEAVMLRGLMLNRALQHFLEDVSWGELDYLLIDMPPGTGDVQMGLARMLPRAEILVVTTPALAAQQVAARAIDMARRGHMRVAGVIENMSSFTASDGTNYALFGSGGGARLSSSTGVPLLAELPLDPAVSAAGDAGEPAVLRAPDGAVAAAFRDLADLITTDIAPAVNMAGCTSRLLAAAEAALDKAPPAS